ncbi:MAG TPA: DUF1622 domain-containing protein, partial [Candidatus Omnitrophota bacterium]|nr:DUF1622 domain-containing protein [Candidatus Omnitrophota bacterium]
MRMIEDAIRVTTLAVETAGIAVIVMGSAMAAIAFMVRWRSGEFEPAYVAFRADLGRAILLGLELLVGADIINTVTLDA